MARTTFLWILIALAFLGIADSWYLAQTALEGGTLVCNIGGGLDGCNVVAKSEYSRVFGIPLGVYGVAFYGLLFAIAATLLTYPNRLLYKAALAVSGFGVLASLYFLYLQLFVIKATCIYCLASLVVAVVSGFVCVMLWRRFAPPQLVVVP